MSAETDTSGTLNLTHHFLIAMPGMQDEMFGRSVVYVCEHSEKGALGIIINKPSDITMGKLFDKVDLPLRREDLELEPVFQGGPVQTERGFVLHDRIVLDASAGDPFATFTIAHTQWSAVAAVKQGVVGPQAQIRIVEQQAHRDAAQLVFLALA